MTAGMLVYKTEILLQGDRFEIQVFCREDGRHFAKTYFGKNDIIINDGRSLEETLKKHEHILPLAVKSRRILQQVKEPAAGRL